MPGTAAPSGQRHEQRDERDPRERRVPEPGEAEREQDARDRSQWVIQHFNVPEDGGT
jgi:hypothetical protein